MALRRVPLRRKTPMARGDSQLKRTRLKPVSDKRAKLNEQRRIVVAKVATTRPFCAWPDCRFLGQHPHEIWTRARSGSADHALLCEHNIVMLCPQHHDAVHHGPFFDYVREVGLIRHGYEGCPCGYPDFPNAPKTKRTGRIERL